MSLGEIISAILEPLPVGFGFRPTDEELVEHYLKLKIQGTGSYVDIIPVIDVCKKEPWQLPDLSVIKTSDPDWFFYNPVDYKYSNGSHFNRQTETGFWKPTGQDREVKSGNNRIGTKKTLVFYRGRGRAAVRTNWVIHEYRADVASSPTDKAYVLCHLKKKPDENTESDIPVPGEAVAGSGNGLPSNTGFGVGTSLPASNIASDIGNYQVEEMLLDEDPELQGLLHETPPCPPLHHDTFPQTERGLHLDFSSPGGFNNGHGSMQFQEFDDGLSIDSDGYPYHRSVAVNRLSARPQSPLRGAYSKGGRSSSDTDNELVHVKEGVLPKASIHVVLDSKESLQIPKAKEQSATSGLSNISQPRKENLVVFGVSPKGVKLEGNDSNQETLQAKLAKLSCSITKLEENSGSIKAKDRAEYGSASDHKPKNNNPIIKDSKKETEVSPKLSSITRCNEQVGSDQKGSGEIHSASHESSCSQAQLFNLVIGMIMLAIFIIIMMLDMVAKF